MVRKLIAMFSLVLFSVACSTSDNNGSDARSDDLRNRGGDVDVPPADTVSGDDVIPLDDVDVFVEDLLGDDGVDDDAATVDVADGGADADTLPDGTVDADGSGDDGGGTVDIGDDIEPPPVEEGWFSSPEMGVKILGPSATGVAQAIGGSIQIAGLVAGNPDAIIWETDTGKTGYAEGAPFWLSGKIDLVQGDNIIWVTAVAGNEEATDKLVVTYNPAFRFGDLKARPFAIFTNTNTTVVFTQDMGLYANFEASTLKLCQCTVVGECISDVKALKDDGQVGSTGDEVGQDGIYSAKMSYNLDEPGKLCFRAHTVVKAGYQQYTAYSPVYCVEVVDHFSQDTCNEITALQQEAKQLYSDTAAIADPATARQTVVEFLQADDMVAEVGTSYNGYGVWARYNAGILGAFPFSPEGLRAGSGDDEDYDYGQIDAPLPGQEILIESKRSMVLSPAHTELDTLDEATFVNNILGKSECPAYVLDMPFYNDKATLMQFRRMSDYGVIAITGHGDSYFKQMSSEAKEDLNWTHLHSQELIWTGEPVDCSKLVQTTPTCSGAGGCPAGSECIITQASGQGTNISGICIDFKQIDLQRGRVVMGPDSYGILPSFIGKYRGTGLPSSVVYLGTCRSLWNGTLGMEFFGAGAKAVLGYSDYITSTFAYEQGTAFWSALVEEMVLTGDALGDNPPSDPNYPTGKLRLLGAPNLNATNADLINASWETGDLTGWQSTGDGRVISRLGITVPVEGKFMGIISTGLGYTPQTGEIFQTFCIPEDKIEMSFYWKYYSEEFKEWCGSVYQDTFEGKLESDDGQITFVDASVDSLCPPQECSGCGGQYDELIQSDVSFDQGDCWMTHWRKAASNVMALAGKGAVTLRFFATDKGDSIYDTAILIDTVKFK
jgi:hypothetical protein